MPFLTCHNIIVSTRWPSKVPWVEFQEERENSPSKHLSVVASKTDTFLRNHATCISCWSIWIQSKFLYKEPPTWWHRDQVSGIQHCHTDFHWPRTWLFTAQIWMDMQDGRKHFKVCVACYISKCVIHSVKSCWLLGQHGISSPWSCSSNFFSLILLK